MTTSGLHFLVVALQCEIDEFERLALAGELVHLLGQLIHALQKERGLSNVFLGSRGARFGQARARQAAECERLAPLARARFEALDTAAQRARNGARLFSRVAVALHALDALPGLRQRIIAQTLPPEEVSAAFVRLIAGLLAVVFEAADSATDPEISRALAALFNFMQGKEFAGQERALGAAVFASGRAAVQHQPAWLRLIESQEGCFQVFSNFCDAAARQHWLALQPSPVQAGLKRLRRIGCAGPEGHRLDAELGPLWYEICTRRIDAMRQVEERLTVGLRELCGRKVAQARAGLRDQQATLAALAREAGSDASAALPAHWGPQLERSVLALLQEQARRQQTMSDELETVRAALTERKLVERAKGLLMAARRLSEDEAHKMLRQSAMNQNKRLVEVAEAVLAATDCP